MCVVLQTLPRQEQRLGSWVKEKKKLSRDLSHFELAGNFPLKMVPFNLVFSRSISFCVKETLMPSSKERNTVGSCSDAVAVLAQWVEKLLELLFQESKGQDVGSFIFFFFCLLTVILRYFYVWCLFPKKNKIKCVQFSVKCLPQISPSFIWYLQSWKDVLWLCIRTCSFSLTHLHVLFQTYRKPWSVDRLFTFSVKAARYVLPSRQTWMSVESQYYTRRAMSFQ